jgi:adenine-specific DNA-methyltransferase
MSKITAEEPQSKSRDVQAENLATLSAMFPELLTEGPDGVAVNLDVLKSLVGDRTVTDAEEKYGLNWHGKRKARQLALTPSTGTLRPCPEDSVNWDTTQNLMIEGDNLEVLKLLQKSYAGKVKLIYIDPPYNTGKDFVYPDNFQDNIKNYLELTGQTGEGGKKLSSNTEASGRFHTDWLNMMYPRLKLARNLLREDGVIFVSIDDSEIHEMKQVLCEVFGEENVIGIIANINNPKGRSDDRFIATSHEYLVAVGTNFEATHWGGFTPEEKVTRRYNKKDAGGQYREIDLRKTGDSDRREDRPDMFYYFYYSPLKKALRVSKERDVPEGDEIEIIPTREDGAEGRWRWGFDTATKQIEGLLSRYMPNRQIWGVFERDYLEGRSLIKPTSSWTFKEVNSERGSEQFVDLGFPKESFPRPKPLGTIQRIIDIGAQPTDRPSLILDFFGGSGTTGHAVMLENSQDEGDRQYILVQLPEPLDPENKDQKVAADYCDKLKKPRTIAELTKERLRRAGKKIKEENPLFTGDLGFRVFKLASSNIQAWEPDRDKLAETLEASIEHLKTDRTEQDILFELLLKLGLDLCVPIEKRKFAGKEVHAIGGGVLFACLAEKIARTDVEALAQGIVAWNKEFLLAVGYTAEASKSTDAKKKKKDDKPETTCVFRDSGFVDDVAKTNLAAILQQHGLLNVRSL